MPKHTIRISCWTISSTLELPHWYSNSQWWWNTESEDSQSSQIEVKDSLNFLKVSLIAMAIKTHKPRTVCDRWAKTKEPSSPARVKGNQPEAKRKRHPCDINCDKNYALVNRYILVLHPERSWIVFTIFLAPKVGRMRYWTGIKNGSSPRSTPTRKKTVSYTSETRTSKNSNSKSSFLCWWSWD